MLKWLGSGAILILLAALGSGEASENRINVLAIGQVLPGESPIPYWFDADPLVDYVLIPTDVDYMLGPATQAGMQVWRRFVRIYFPKTRDDLMEDFDFFVFPDGNIDPFTPSQISDMRFAMENGLGSFVTLGGDLAAPSHTAFPGWLSSTLYEIMPAELNEKMKQTGDEFRIRVLKDDPPVLSVFVPLGIEGVRASIYTYLFPKAGATVWANLVSPSLPPYAPGAWLASWKVGAEGGVFWAVADDLDAPFWSPLIRPCENDYSMDIFLNILLYSTGRVLPTDILALHDLRSRYWQYNQEKAMLISLLEFVDRFGASTRSLELRIQGTDHLRERSFEEYRNQEYEGALDTVNEAIGAMLQISDDAMTLKDRALFWVYVTEWSSVMGTLFASGFVVYSLLVKRRLYREVSVTRAH